MFNRKLVDMLHREREINAALHAELGAARTALAIAQNNFEWARLRLNHIEDERSALIYRVANITIPVPHIERSGQQSMADTSKPLLDELMKKLSFEDLGDDEARRQGVDHEKE